MLTRDEKNAIRRHWFYYRLRFLADGSVDAQQGAGRAWGALYSASDAIGHLKAIGLRKIGAEQQMHLDGKPWWYVKSLPGCVAGDHRIPTGVERNSDWEWTSDINKAFPLSKYWQRRFLARRNMGTASTQTTRII